MSDQIDKPNYLGSSFAGFMNQFIGESDRAAVILGAAKVELLLGQILDKFLLPSAATSDDLLEGEAPLSTFSAKIKACHRLGLIDDQFCKLLNIFRRLRNGFAHEVTTDSLSVGSTRDRVAALAEPFAHTAYFQTILRVVTKDMNRKEDDMGALFRATLALFHIHLLRIHGGLTPIKRTELLDIVEMCRQSKSPEKTPSTAP